MISTFAQGFGGTGLLVEALALHLIVKLGLRALSCQRLQALLAKMPAVPAKRGLPPVLIRGADPKLCAIVRAVRAAARPFGGASCLSDALVAYAMLNRRGHAPRICYGVRRGEVRSLEGHAWVECDGAVVIGDVPELARYALLA